MNFGPAFEGPPPGIATTTSSSPAAVAAVLALISVADTTSTPVAALPIFTVAPFTNPVPLITTPVPPNVEPDDGSTALTLGGRTNVNLGPSVEASSSTSTTTSLVPAELSAVVALISVSETTSTPVASPPMRTVAPFTKPVPLIVTAVLPVVGPWAGVTDVTVGAAATAGVTLASGAARMSPWPRGSATAGPTKLSRKTSETGSASAQAREALSCDRERVRSFPCPWFPAASFRLNTASPPG